MPKLKHTPGPWHENKATLSVYTPDGRLIVDMPINDGTGKVNISAEERFANLRLIAVAPTMLEALRGACKNCIVCNNKVCEECKIQRVLKQIEE